MRLRVQPSTGKKSGVGGLHLGSAKTLPQRDAWLALSQERYSSNVVLYFKIQEKYLRFTSAGNITYSIYEHQHTKARVAFLSHIDEAEFEHFVPPAVLTSCTPT